MKPRQPPYPINRPLVPVGTLGLLAVVLLGVGLKLGLFGLALSKAPRDSDLRAHNPMLSLKAGVGGASHYDLFKPSVSYPTSAYSVVNHSPSIAGVVDGGLGAGGLVMAWFGGSREGARDVQIFVARFDGHAWSSAIPALSTDGIIRTTGRYLTKLGNPVLYSNDGQLHLWFVSVSLGGWGGARLNHMRSLDGGISWSVPRLLVASPFLNVSTLVRTPPVHSSVSRETLLPAYFELTQKYPLMLRFDAQARLVDRYPFGGRTGLLQPSVIPSAAYGTLAPVTETGLRLPAQSQPQPQPQPQPTSTAADAPPSVPTPWNSELRGSSLTAYFRRGQALQPAEIFWSRSDDGGLNWSLAQATGLPNGDASIAALPDGPVHWVIANPNSSDRDAIAVYRLVPDQLPTLPGSVPKKILDQARNTEFSYPSLATSQDGKLHLVYTADGRKTIRHRVWVPEPKALSRAEP